MIIIDFFCIVPLYAQLERSMTNEARIYLQRKEEASHEIKKLYLYSENCNGKIMLTQVCNMIYGLPLHTE